MGELISDSAGFPAFSRWGNGLLSKYEGCVLIVDDHSDRVIDILAPGVELILESYGSKSLSVRRVRNGFLVDV